MAPQAGVAPAARAYGAQRQGRPPRRLPPLLARVRPAEPDAQAAHAAAAHGPPEEQAVRGARVPVPGAAPAAGGRGHGQRERQSDGQHRRRDGHPRVQRRQAAGGAAGVEHHRRHAQPDVVRDPAHPRGGAGRGAGSGAAHLAQGHPHAQDRSGEERKGDRAARVPKHVRHPRRVARRARAQVAAAVARNRRHERGRGAHPRAV
mmetsp:Transcript_6945/g.22002  ORF Transcript_6945/g.22002 Transcript_6945/m.22002 type:complete len:204 (-) Transcript_6945:562-1173(-)